jgi:hypothetical protein
MFCFQRISDEESAVTQFTGFMEGYVTLAEGIQQLKTFSRSKWHPLFSIIQEACLEIILIKSAHFQNIYTFYSLKEVYLNIKNLVLTSKKTHHYKHRLMTLRKETIWVCYGTHTNWRNKPWAECSCCMFKHAVRIVTTCVWRVYIVRSKESKHTILSEGKWFVRY